MTTYSNVQRLFPARTVLLILALAALVLLLSACGLLSPAEQQNALEVIEQMRANGTITEAQFAALRESILAGGSGQWWEQLATVAVSAGLAWIGVRSNIPGIGRGAPTQKVGLPASKVKT